jgi:hypothetical protein
MQSTFFFLYGIMGRSVSAEGTNRNVCKSSCVVFVMYVQVMKT